MKKALLSLSVLTVIIAFSACKKKDVAPPNTANVMFVNGCAGTNNVDVYINNVKQNNASNIGFLKNSGYQSINSGSGINIAFLLTQQGTPLSNSTQTLNVSAHYSAFTAGLVTGTSLVFTTDDINTPTAGKAKVRFINLSSDNLKTSCYVGTTKLDSNIGYQAYTPFYEVTATTTKVAMIDQNILTNSGQINSQQLSAGKIYTFMLTGTASGVSTSVLTLSVINNN